MSVEMPINSVVTVRHEYVCGADVSFNLLHYRLRQAIVISTGLPLATSPIADVVLPALSGSAYAEWAVVWAPAACEGVTYTSCTTQSVYPSTRSVPYTYTADPATEGDVAGDLLPMQDCVTILKKTGIGERWGLGRMYFSGLAESVANSGYITDDQVTNMAGLISHMDDELSVTVSGVQYYFRPTVTNVPTDGFPRVNDIVQCSLSNKVIKTQRRRRPGKGM